MIKERKRQTTKKRQELAALPLFDD